MYDAADYSKKIARLCNVIAQFFFGDQRIVKNDATLTDGVSKVVFFFVIKYSGF